jgi:DNA mismatch repair protein MutL
MGGGDLAATPGLDPVALWRSLYAPTESSGLPAPLAARPAYLPPIPPRPRAVQMHNLYLVAETEEGILIVDQHALHERVIYEQLRERIAQGSLESQRLLLPETIRVAPEQMALLESRDELFRRLGIEATPFGADSIAVHTFPSLLRDADVHGFMSDLLDYLGRQAAGASLEAVIHKVLDMMACKAAVKAGDPLTEEEIEALIRQRHLIDKATSCPHGRPTLLRLTKADLNRQFKR